MRGGGLVLLLSLLLLLLLLLWVGPLMALLGAGLAAEAPGPGGDGVGLIGGRVRGGEVDLDGLELAPEAEEPRVLRPGLERGHCRIPEQLEGEGGVPQVGPEGQDSVEGGAARCGGAVVVEPPHRR